MARDHYATLGVTPTSEDVVIRAAYRALMRLYHPDADPSSEASHRAKAINDAYAVLGDPAKRARYDGSLAAQHMIKPEGMRAGRRLVPGPAGWIALVALAATIALIVISPPIGNPPDALPLAGPHRVHRAGAADPGNRTAAASDAGADLCGDAAIPNLIRAELIKRAAIVEGAHRGQMHVLNTAAVRVDSPALNGERQAGTAGCRAWLALNLPPGTIVEGGRTNLNTEVTYAVAQSHEGPHLAGLSGVGAIVRSLATLSPQPHPEAEVDLRSFAAIPVVQTSEGETVRSRAVEVVPPKRLPAQGAVDAASVDARVSTNPACRAFTSWADRTVCDDSNLAGLDRQLGLLYSQSWSRADQSKRNSLAATREQFRTLRNGCRSEACLTSAYVARLREVSAIMAARPQP